MHVTHELLMAVIEGTLPRKALEKIVMEHLGALCPTCQREIETFDWKQYRKEVPDPSVYRAPIERVAAQVAQRRSAYEKSERQAKRWIRELSKYPLEEMRGKIDRALTRFRGEVFAALLVEESRKYLPDDPWTAHAWADAAFVAQYHTSGLKKSPEIMVRIMGYRGNAQRVMGRLNDADADMRYARRLVDDNEVTDLSVCAELDCLEASLRRDQRHLQLAEDLLHRAVALYRILDDTELRARTEVVLGTVYYEQDKPEEAIRAAQSALQDLSFDENPRLYLSARFNMARALTSIGEPQQAVAILDDDEEHWNRLFDQLMRLNATWIRGEAALALDKKSEAAKRFEAAREGFAELRVGYDVAMVSLQLSLLLLERGETAQVKQIAREAFEIFGSQNVHREAFGALKVFRDAAVAERLTAETVQKVYKHIRLYGRMPAEERRPS